MKKILIILVCARIVTKMRWQRRSTSNVLPVESVHLAVKEPPNERGKNLPEERGRDDEAGLTGQVSVSVCSQIIGFSA